MTDVRIAEIHVGERHRTDLGDLRGLMASIAGVGLLHPIVVTSDRRLVAGARRLQACKNLGWKTVPVTEATSAQTVRDLLVAERDENTCRIDMKPSEKVSLGLALEAIERPKAEDRRKAGNIRGGRGHGEVGSKVNPTSGNENKTHRIVGAAVGMSGTTYHRARRVYLEAQAGNPVAIEALAEMDATGKVATAYRRVFGEAERPPRRGRRTKLGDVLEPLRQYLKTWDEAYFHGLAPNDARRLLEKLNQVEHGLFELHRALEARTVKSRALE